MENWIIYGSYGYTGNLIAEMAAKNGDPIILAGRDEKKLQKQSDRLQLEYRTVDLFNTLQLKGMLTDATLVIHCAGPFQSTWKPMLDACIKNRTHYLDITGEIGVFEKIKQRDNEISESGIMAMPGTGFDIVPTDCLALRLKQEMPDAHQLELAFMSIGGGISRGTALTVAENLGKGGAIRQNGLIKKVPAGWRSREVDFGLKKRMAVSIPWGDVSTAYFTTGIENIIVYTSMKPSRIRLLRLSRYINSILRSGFIKNRLKNWIRRNIEGPDPETRNEGMRLIWGQVENEFGETAEVRLKTLEAYRFTGLAALLIAGKVASGNYKTGFQTPAAVYGQDLVLEIDGSEWLDESSQIVAR